MIFGDDFNFEILEVLRFFRHGKAFKITKSRSFAVISCRLSGETTFGCGGKETYASKDDYVIVPAGIEYSQTSSDEELICVHIATEGLELSEILGFHCSAPRLRDHFITLHDIWLRRESGYMLKCKSLIYQILFELVKSRQSEEIRAGQGVIEPSVKYIREHYCDRDFSLSEAIAKAYVSPAYFRRIFKSVYGMTPNAFINYLKIEHAKILLSGRGRTLREISESVGFLNEKYFFGVFKRTTGYTPTEWLGRN